MSQPRFQQKLIGVIIAVVFLTGCSSPTSTPTLTSTPTSTQTLVPTSTPDIVLARKAATIFEQDFETGTALGVFDMNGNWAISIDNTGNHIFCNEISEDWQSFKFGLETWANYSVEARVKFPDQNANQSAEVYARINSSTDGYRASLYQGRAGLSYYPPSQSLGGRSITTQANTWYTFRVEVAGNHIKFYINDQPVADGIDTQRLTGMAGFGAGPNTKTCVDDIRVWALTNDGQIAVSPLARYENCEFCFLKGEDPLEPVWDASVQGFTYRDGDPREIITIDENYKVPAGKTITFENKIILVKPLHRKDIEVFGTLIIRNSLLIWQQTENQQTRLRVKRGGTLIINDSYAFPGNPYWVNWDYEDGSTINFNHFVGNPWTTIHGSVNYTAINYSTVKLTFLNDMHDASVQISNAHELWLELFPSEGTYTITFPAKRQWADWGISDLWPNTNVEVKDSYIYERDISINNNTHVTIQDTPSGFGLGWTVHKDGPGYIDCELRNLGEPGDTNGIFYEDKTWDLPCNNSSLTVKNSLLQRAWPGTYGYVHLKIFDSDLVDPGNYGRPATMEIYNSTMDIVAAYQGGRVYVENSPIKEAIQVYDPYSTIYGFGVTGTYQLMEADGGTYITLDKPGPPWK